MSGDATYADGVFKHLGFEVQKIPTANVERADWLVKHPSTAVLVEEKTKFDDPRVLAARRVVLERGEVFPSQVPIKPDDGLARITKKAVKQIVATAGAFPHQFRVVWFTAAGRNPEARRMQYVATLYGSSNIFRLGSPHLTPCYFFRNSDFFRHRHVLDGAVVAELAGEHISSRLCLNPLSPRYEQFKECRIVHAFGTAIVDPIREEQDSDAYMADCDIDRAKSDEVLRYLEAKYGIENIMHMDLGMMSGEILVGDEADG